MTFAQDLTLPSTFGLTCLLFIGLGFFIRASTKDRTETALYDSKLDDVELLDSLKEHFAQRAYQVVAIDTTSGSVTLAGNVGASIFLAVFLGGLAGVGLLCLVLVLAIAFPDWGILPYVLLLGTPIAPWFYWRGAARQESVTFQLNPSSSEPQDASAPEPACLLVSAHRDELIALESSVSLKRRETE